MGFLKENEHFIQIKLISELRNLTIGEKLQKYNENLRVETRGRLKTFYSKVESNSGEKITFFREALETLALYESEYLLLSIFFNEHGNSIFNYIFANKLKIEFKGIQDHFFLPHLLQYYYSGNKPLISFVQQEFSNLIQLSDGDWINFQKYNVIERKFCDFIILNLKEKDGEKKIFKGLYLYTRIWNQFFQAPFNTEKSIFLLDKFLLQYKGIEMKEIKVSMNSIIESFKEDTCYLLANFKHSPLTEPCAYNEGYKKGYLIKKKEFNVFLQELNWFKNIGKISFKDLFSLINSSNGKMANEIIKQINDRLNRGILPSIEELEEIHKIQLKQEYINEKYLFLERNYYFQNLT